VVHDVAVSEEEKKSDKLWKLRPLLHAVRQGCLQQKRGIKVSIDERMIAFSGTTKLKQYVPNKPHPVGLKKLCSCKSAPQNLTYSLREAGGGNDWWNRFQPGMEVQSILGTPVG